MIRVDGNDEVLLRAILTNLKEKMGYKTQKETLSKLIDALSYNVVMAEVEGQLLYLENEED